MTKLQTKISTAQLELFNESALPEAVTLHADRPGFFSLLVKPAASLLGDPAAMLRTFFSRPPMVFSGSAVQFGSCRSDSDFPRCSP